MLEPAARAHFLLMKAAAFEHPARTSTGRLRRRATAGPNKTHSIGGALVGQR
jgi:hypothetical protein